MVKNEPLDNLTPPNYFSSNLRRSSAPAELLGIPENPLMLSTESCLSPYSSSSMSLLSPQSDDGYQIPSPCSTTDYIESVRSPIYPPMTGNLQRQKSISKEYLPEKPNFKASSGLTCSSPLPSGTPYLSAPEISRPEGVNSAPCSPLPSKLNHEYHLSAFNNIKPEPIDDKYNNNSTKHFILIKILSGDMS